MTTSVRSEAYIEHVLAALVIGVTYGLVDFITGCFGGMGRALTLRS